MAGYPLRAVVGLGNPGADHARTRHTAGFWFVDRLAQVVGATFRTESRFRGELARGHYADSDLLLLKPSTFMNLSGEAVQPLAAFYKLAPSEILVVHDELDLPAGTARLKRGGGHGGHNGLRSLHQHLGPDYLRLRIGIGHPGHRDRVLGYVLGRPSADDEANIDHAFDDALSALQVMLRDGWDKAAQQLHTATDPARSQANR